MKEERIYVLQYAPDRKQIGLREILSLSRKEKPLKEYKNDYPYDDYHAGYYQLPKCVVLDEKYQRLNNKSKILYAMKLGRMALSELNRWEDSKGKIYIYFTIDSIVSEMGVSVETAVK